jgi:hypothetical protein
MPSPRNKAKATGDIHLPEIESEDLDVQGSHPQGAGIPGTQQRDRDGDGVGSPPRAGNRGGVITDREAPMSDNGRDNGGEGA